MKRSSSILEVLRSTLEYIEHDPELRQEDPELMEFKRSLEQSIAELESKRLKKAA